MAETIEADLNAVLLHFQGFYIHKPVSQSPIFESISAVQASQRFSEGRTVNTFWSLQEAGNICTTSAHTSMVTGSDGTMS